MPRHRGSIRMRAGAWEVSVYAGVGPDGKRVYRYARVKGSKLQAKKKLTEILGKLDTGTLPSPTRETLDQYLDRWLAAKKASLSRRTHSDYTYLLVTHVRPVAGALRLADLRPVQVQGVYDAMTERGLSGRTVHVTHNVLRQALAQAVRWRELAVNPADGVTLPKWGRAEMTALTAGQVRHFLEKAEGDPLADYFHLAFASGMRPSELLGLRWEAVDLQLGQVHVRHALERVGKEWRLKEPKTHSLRTIPLPGPVVDRLRGRQLAQKRAALRRKPERVWIENGLVFPGRFGEPLDTRNVSKRHLKPILQQAELPAGFRLYDTRHTCATLLAAAGENSKVIAERLGHRGVEITLNVYTHVSPGMQRQATETIGGALYG